MLSDPGLSPWRFCPQTGLLLATHIFGTFSRHCEPPNMTAYDCQPPINCLTIASGAAAYIPILASARSEFKYSLGNESDVKTACRYMAAHNSP
jgi:hypothetical protein